MGEMVIKDGEGGITIDPLIARMSADGRALLFMAMDAMEEIDAARNKHEACPTPRNAQEPPCSHPAPGAPPVSNPCHSPPATSRFVSNRRCGCFRL